jgi:hypothetical protein
MLIHVHTDLFHKVSELLMAEAAFVLILKAVFTGCITLQGGQEDQGYGIR